MVVALEADRRPQALIGLLENSLVPKIFHNALFDLSFLRCQWECLVEPVFCTKVAARLAGTSRNPTLQYLAEEMLGVSLDKGPRLSDWSSRPLSPEQVRYAAGDVIHLHEIQRILSWKVADVGKTALFEECMAFLKIRADWKSRLSETSSHIAFQAIQIENTEGRPSPFGSQVLLQTSLG